MYHFIFLISLLASVTSRPQEDVYQQYHHPEPSVQIDKQDVISPEEIFKRVQEITSNKEGRSRDEITGKEEKSRLSILEKIREVNRKKDQLLSPEEKSRQEILAKIKEINENFTKASQELLQRTRMLNYEANLIQQNPFFYQTPILYQQPYVPQPYFYPSYSYQRQLELPNFPIIIQNPLQLYNTLTSMIEYAPQSSCKNEERGAKLLQKSKAAKPGWLDKIKNRKPTPAPQHEDDLKLFVASPGAKRNEGNGIIIHRLKVRKGGVAIAGPGGIATAGSGGTAIVGPNGVAYTHPDSLAIAGSGTKVIAVDPSVNLRDLISQDQSSQARVGKIVATGPVIYYNKG